MDIKSNKPSRALDSNRDPNLDPRVAAADKQLRDVASLYEKQFLREMVKQMRSSVTESEWMPSSFAEKYYREQLDHQYVESWGDGGGIGLGKMIYDQLLERYGERMGIRIPKERPQGPLPLSHRDQWQGEIGAQNRALQFRKREDPSGASVRNPVNAQDRAAERVAERGAESASDRTSDRTADRTADRTSELTSPWEGQWMGSYLLPSGMRVAKIQHGKMVSTFVGQFNLRRDQELSLGAEIKAGESFGEMPSGAKEFYWKIQE
jgi:Rod binding domain-containing protein